VPQKKNYMLKENGRYFKIQIVHLFACAFQ